jgi:hypothetical protein
MPTEDGMMEVATCFQTIALVSDQSGEAAELGRALIPEGVPLLLMSRAQPQGDTELERNALKTGQLARPDIDRAHQSYLLKIEILTKRQGSGLSFLSLQIAAIESGDSSN